jgi:predicted house-cleaning noncanonical NTP pyrophosphatase (MazG superfamily)
MTEYHKLVRDRIPEIIRASGRDCEVRVLGDAEYAAKLDEKLREELDEYAASGSVEELADLVEVVHAILAFRGVTAGDFEALRVQKHGARGGFVERLLLERVSD